MIIIFLVLFGCCSTRALDSSGNMFPKPANEEWYQARLLSELSRRYWRCVTLSGNGNWTTHCCDDDGVLQPCDELPPWRDDHVGFKMNESSRVGGNGPKTLLVRRNGVSDLWYNQWQWFARNDYGVDPCGCLGEFGQARLCREDEPITGDPQQLVLADNTALDACNDYGECEHGNWLCRGFITNYWEKREHINP